MNFLLNSGDAVVGLILAAVLIVLLIFMLVVNNKKRKEYLEQVKETQEKFIIGAKVKTYAGFYGEIVNIRETIDGTKVLTIRVGSEKNFVDMDIDINFVSSIDEKDVAKPDAELTQLMDKVDETSKALDEKSEVIDTEDKKDEESKNEEEKDSDVKVEEKSSKTKKKTTKK